MTTIKHTPGPWEISNGELYEFNEADAKLIAAAPELFEVCNEIYEWAIKTKMQGPIFPKLEAAIKKATL